MGDRSVRWVWQWRVVRDLVRGCGKEVCSGDDVPARRRIGDGELCLSSL